MYQQTLLIVSGVLSNMPDSSLVEFVLGLVFNSMLAQNGQGTPLHPENREG
jgi:hypothetical protein